MKYILPILLYSVSACSLFGGENGPGALPLSELQAAPDTLELGDQRLALRTFMWRDFQPPAPHDGHRLVAVFWIHTTDSTALPTGLTADAAWVVNGQEVWDTWFSSEEPPMSERQPYQQYRIAREGPKWGPDVVVFAVVRLRHGQDQESLLRATPQTILRTD